MNDDLEEDVVSSDEGFDDFSKKSKERGFVSTPTAKVGIVLAVIAGLVGIVMMFGEEAEEVKPSALPGGSEVTSIPGAQEATPAYREAVEEQNEENLERALQTGESAIPVPVDAPEDRLQAPVEEEQTEDPLSRWRALQEERVEREIREQETVEAVTVLDSEKQGEAVRQLSETMTAQMQSILQKNDEQKIFHYIGLVKKQATGAAQAGGVPGGAVPPGGQPPGGNGNFQEDAEKEVIIPTGEIEYAQLLLEANSEIKGPVMGILMTGPLKGSKIIGSFSVADDKYLVLNFEKVVVDGKDVSISGIGLDPNTSLAGMATDVDNRYFRRIVLPAAAAFITGFADAIAETGRTDVIVPGGSNTSDEILVETEEADDEERVATGVKEAATEVSEILDDMADVDPIVKIEAGTPLGILFTAPVYEEETDI